MNGIDSINKGIKEIIIEELGFELIYEELEDEMKIKDGGLYLDSIALVRLIIAVERKFKIRFDDDNLDFEKINNIGALTDYVYNRMRAGYGKGKEEEG